MSILRQEVELTVQLGHERAEMSAVGIVSWHPDIEVMTMRSYCGPDGLVLLLVTTNPIRASQVLEAAGFKCKGNPVILFGPLYRAGLAASVVTELAVLGINVLYSYVSRAGVGYQYLVFKTTEDDRAMQVLEASASVRNAFSETGQSLQETAA